MAEERDPLEEAIEESVKTWNEFVGDFIDAKKKWSHFQSLVTEFPKIVDKLPRDLQRVLARYRREVF